MVDGHNGRKISKNCQWEIFVTRLKIFWIFQLWGQFSRKSVRRTISSFVSISTKSTMENRNMKWKPEPEVVLPPFWQNAKFLGFSRANISVAMGIARLIFGAVSCISDLNIREKNLGQSSRASYISKGRYFGNLGVSSHLWGGLRPRPWPLGPIFFGVVH